MSEESITMREALMLDIKDLKRQRDEARKELNQLANTSVYKGNSVAYIYDKNQAYKTSIDQLLRERDQLKSDLWAEKTEHRMTKTTLSALAAERNQLRRALAQVAEDCVTWLNTATYIETGRQARENYGTALQMIKRLRAYAHEQCQAPLAPSS